jgi:hypothetical protein
MKLNKAKKERIEAYLDMLKFHCDVMSMFTTEKRLNFIECLETIIGEEYYNKHIDKKILNQMEKIYHRNKIVWS